MPETAITPKSSSSLSASTSSREDTNQFFNEKKLSRCIQRKFLTYSQLAVKCHRPGRRQYRPPRTSFKLTGLYHTTINRSPAINTATSCPDNSPCPILRMIGAPCKKSLSMIDLTPLAMENENGDVRSDSSSTGERGIEEHEKVKEDLGVSVGIKKWIDGFAAFAEPEESSRFFQRPDKAASVICRVLMLNAWRRRRDEVQYLHGTIYDLNQQIEHLYLQIIVLRRLLDTENNRISKLTAEAHRAKIQFDEAVKGNNTLKSEKEKMQEEMKRLTELAEERLVAAENLRNELLSAENQLHGLDEQMSKEREKLLKLREDKRILLEKVTASEALATERGARADKAESIVEELQLKLANQIALVESSQEQIERYSKELRIKEEEKNKLMERLKSTENTGRILNLRAVSLEAQLIDRNMTLQRIEAAFNSQLSELNELKDRLIRQSQEVGWSSRMLQIAGTVVRAPRALLRTLLSGPMLTS
ncbi:WEB family protein At5g16730, chloroplastic [Ceratina calcarata]|uniref:WEB family protein At5g16730, chloroplastic n=1 Tax=Ceratina calcarata TaxID=156304 RepID=A0AAJ7IVA6_9HYME|nr:WEB family protein At5g16730, chloroplastic [Ceratina calcarata]